jgi:hypothetical protein
VVAAQSRARRVLRAVVLQIIIILVTLAAVEVILRVADPRFLRDSERLLAGGGPGSRDILLFRHDEELGWSPIPNSSATYVGSHPISIQHNSLGLRDIEHDRVPKPTIMFLGDSIVWGFDVEAEQRFTEQIRQELPDYRIVNAGVSGYGTDQEYLLLKRIWNDVEPNVVVLMFSVDTDRSDNTSNARYDFHYKPYFRLLPTGELQLQGQPVPHSRHVYFNEDPIARHSWLARVAVSVYLQLRHGGVSVPDPTERLLDMIRQFVEAHGASFMVGLQSDEPQLEAFLRAQHIPYVSFEGAERYATQGGHWTPKGQALVASRLMTLLAETGAVQVGPSANVLRPNGIFRKSGSWLSGSKMRPRRS